MQQIEEDRRERKERRTGVPAPAASIPAAAAVPAAIPPAAVAVPASATVQVQLRLSSGRPVRSTFASTATLAELAAWARSSGETGDFYFVQPFPQRSFEHTDAATASLADLGLAPTASLAVRKRPDAPAPPVVAAQPAVVQVPSPALPPAPGSPMAEDAAAGEEDEDVDEDNGMDGDEAPEARDNDDDEEEDDEEDASDDDADARAPPPFGRWGAPGRGFGRGGANILPIAPPLGGRRRPGPAFPQAQPQRLGSSAGAASSETSDDIRARRAAALTARAEVAAVPAPADAVPSPAPAPAVAVASNPQARELARYGMPRCTCRARHRPLT